MHRRADVARRARSAIRATRMRRIDAAGWLRGAVRIPSPNRDDRAPGERITLVVVHGISLPPGRFGGRAIAQLFTNTLDPAAHRYFATIAALRVSAHVLVRRNGALIQFVPFGERAWHAGASQWRGRDRCNDFSIGIELEGSDTARYTPAQYRRLAAVIAALGARYPIEAVVGHSDVAPGRKTDPGPSFDWRRLLARLPARLAPDAR